MGEPHYNTDAMKAARQVCIDRAGVCGADCPNALESMDWTCMIRHTPQVVQKLGEIKPPAGVRRGFDATCQECGDSFAATLKRARFCQPCRTKRLRAREKARKTAARLEKCPVKPCDICSAVYQPLNSLQRYCHGCKDQDLRLYKCGGCGGDYVAVGRQKYTRRCEGCKAARKAG